MRNIKFKIFFASILLIFFGFPLRLYFRLPIYPHKRGEYTTTFNTNDASILNWASKFDIVEIGGVGDITPRKTIQFLKERNVKRIFLYDWMPAVYYYIDDFNYSFVNWIYENRYHATLNPDGPFPHTQSEGYDFARDYYLDFAYSDVVSKRVDFICDLSIMNGYNGIFYDWGPGMFIFEPEYSAIKENFNNRHPDISYLTTVGNFYRQLRHRCDEFNIQIMSNQGYRNGKNVLPYVDYDMAESYIVGFDYYGRILDVDGYGEIEVPETDFFPVSEPGNESFSDTLFYLDEIESLIKKFAGSRFKKFIFMDYAAPEFKFDSKKSKYIPFKPKDAIFLSFATAKLINQVSYLQVPFDPHLEFSNIYFVDLGKPLQNYYLKNDIEKYAIRFFQNGFTLVYYGNQLEKEILLNSNFIPDDTYYFDLYTNRWEFSSDHVIKLKIKTKVDKRTGKTIPAGRIVMYGNINRIILQ